MCGIVGYTGREAAAPIVLNGLSKLEYRGYDSAGVAVFNEAENDIDIVKTKGRLKNLLEKTDSGKAMPGGCGIGHTRWATMAHLLRRTRILIVVMTRWLLWFITESLRTIRN